MDGWMDRPGYSIVCSHLLQPPLILVSEILRETLSSPPNQLQINHLHKPVAQNPNQYTTEREENNSKGMVIAAK